MYNYLNSYFRGLYLGLTIVFSSLFMDTFISKKSMEKLNHDQILLYLEGWRAVITNLVLVEPFFYSVAAFSKKPTA